MRDGYAGYEHLSDAVHAWCGAHGLRDLAGLYRFDPDGQVWARSMADLLAWANKQATAARAADQASLGEKQLAEIRSWYRSAVAKGITDNQHKRSKTAKDGLRLARRFRDHQDMILQFATDLTVGFTSNEANAGSGPSKSSSAPPAGAGAPCRASPTAQPSSPTCPPPPSGASTPSLSCSPKVPGYQPQYGPAE